jgi:hypothetical protein
MQPETHLEPDAASYRVNLHSAVGCTCISAVNRTFQVSCKGEGGSHDAPEPSKATPRLIVADEPEPNGVVRVNANQQKRVKLLSTSAVVDRADGHDNDTSATTPSGFAPVTKP